MFKNYKDWAISSQVFDSEGSRGKVQSIGVEYANNKTPTSAEVLWMIVLLSTTGDDKMKKCLYCGKEFNNTKHKECVYCSKSCSVKDRYKEDVGLFRKDVDEDIKRYILGLFITDGCLTKNGNEFVMVISLKEEYMIEKIKNIVCPTKKVYKDGNNYQVRWRNKKDIRTLNKLKIYQRKTKNIPFINIKRYKWDFIRGIFDGDGCVYCSYTIDKNSKTRYDYKSISFTTGCEQFARDLNLFLNQNNIHSKVNKDNRKDVWYVRIYKQQDVCLLKDKMYQNKKDWFLKRKYLIF